MLGASYIGGSPGEGHRAYCLEILGKLLAVESGREGWTIAVCWEGQKGRGTWHWLKRTGCGPTLGRVVWEVCVLLHEKATLENYAGAANEQFLGLTFSVTTTGDTRSAASRQLIHCTMITHIVASRSSTSNSIVCPPTLEGLDSLGRLILCPSLLITHLPSQNYQDDITIAVSPPFVHWQSER